MYGFRKPFTAVTFDGVAPLFNIDFKILLIIAQVIGYTISKFYGIKFISEIMKDSRGKSIIILIAIAELALFGFASFQNSYLRLFFLFLNGLPLGMIWGLVFNYLEGRKYTDLLGAGLSVSFIFASGFVKTVGKNLIVNFGVSDFWMPFFTGAIFIVPLLIFVWMLEQIPPPTAEDEALRTKRQPMFKKERKAFLSQYYLPVLLTVLTYIGLTVIRSIRDDFAADIWTALGQGSDPSVFMKSETPVALLLMGMVGIMFLIKNNRTALLINSGLVVGGMFILLLSTILFESGSIAPLPWMIATGVGLYMAYVPFNCIIFERMIAALKFSGTAGFLIYVADAWGYLGSVGILFYKNFFNTNVDWKTIFIEYCFYIGGLSLLLSVFALIYFVMKVPKEPAVSVSAS